MFPTPGTRAQRHRPIVAVDTTDLTCWVGFYTAASGGNLQPKTNNNLTFSPANNAFSVGASLSQSQGTFSLNGTGGSQLTTTAGNILIAPKVSLVLASVNTTSIACGNSSTCTSISVTVTPSGTIFGATDGQLVANYGGVGTGVPLPNSICDFRLTPTSGSPVITADATSISTLYMSPFKGNRIGLYSGTQWLLRASAEFSLAIGSVVTYQMYDVFVYDNSGTPTMEKLEWHNASVTFTSATPTVVTWTGHGMATNDSVTFTTTGSMPTGVSANTQYFVTVVDANTFKISTTRANVASATFVAASSTGSSCTGHEPQSRQTALTTQDGVLVKSGDATRRYVGSFLADSTTTTQCSFGGVTTQVGGKWFVWSYYNPVQFTIQVFDSTTTWTYTTATFRQYNATAGNLVEAIIGYTIAQTKATTQALCRNTTNSAGVQTGVGLDSTNTNSVNGVKAGGTTSNNSTAGSNPSVTYVGYPAIGYHAFVPLEYSAAVGTTNWFGSNVTGNQVGLTAEIWA